MLCTNKKCFLQFICPKNDLKKIKGGNSLQCTMGFKCVAEGERCGANDCICERISSANLQCMSQDIVKAPTP
jgi:hypothetical protein